MNTNSLTAFRATIFSIFLFGFFGFGWGQTTVYWRTDGPSSGNWEWGLTCESAGDGQWFFNYWGGFRRRPDCFGSHKIYFDGNGLNTMNLNSTSDYNANWIIFTANATQARSLSTNASRKLKFYNSGNIDPKIENLSSAEHTFSVNIDVFNWMEINPLNGNLVFNGQVSLGDNQLRIWGNNGKSLSFNNTIQGSGATLIVQQNSLVNLNALNTYTGLTTVNAGTLRLNNTGGNTLPNTNSITVNSGGTLKISTNQTLASLTINSGGTVIVDPNVQLTINGALTNNGTFTMESGATFKQGTSIEGTGTFNVKQTVTGGNNGTTASGRFWYMGVPMSGLTKGTAFGTASGPSETKVWQFIETAASGWGSPLSSSISLQEGRGYAIRSGESNPTFTFSGNNLFTTDTTISLSYTSGFGNGYHLLSNSYMAPISWEDILTSSLNISPTYWVRSYNGANQALIFDTYNATSNESVSPSLQTTNQYIAPLQSFWVRALPNQSVRSVNMTRAMTSHQTANVLKSSIDFPVYARVNLVDDAKFDQALIYMNQDISTAFDDYDSEKMFVAGMAQIYTQVSNKKLVINGLKNNKKKSSIPLYLELPTSKVYQLQLNEFNMEEGLILLEDKLEGTIQDFTINDTYTFYASSGVLTNRFVLHFLMPDATIAAQGPSNSWVNEEAIVNDGGSIQVSSNGSGIVTIQQDIDATATEKGAVVVRDASGREVYNSPLEGAETIIQLDAPSGVYFVEVSVQGQVEVKKIFIQE